MTTPLKPCPDAVDFTDLLALHYAAVSFPLPTPEEFQNLAYAHQNALGKLRAHIAAQAEKIAELEAQLLDHACDDDEREMNEQYIEELTGKVAALESENKRLREENKKVDIQAGINIGLVKASCKNTAYAMKKIRLLQEGLAEAIDALVEMRKEHKYVHIYSDKMKKLAALAAQS